MSAGHVGACVVTGVETIRAAPASIVIRQV